MDKSIFVANSGAKAALQRQEVLAHNLANASAVGAKADRLASAPRPTGQSLNA